MSQKAHHTVLTWQGNVLLFHIFRAWTTAWPWNHQQHFIIAALHERELRSSAVRWLWWRTAEQQQSAYARVHSPRFKPIKKALVEKVRGNVSAWDSGELVTIAIELRSRRTPLLARPLGPLGQQIIFCSVVAFWGLSFSQHILLSNHFCWKLNLVMTSLCRAARYWNHNQPTSAFPLAIVTANIAGFIKFPSRNHPRVSLTILFWKVSLAIRTFSQWYV